MNIKKPASMCTSHRFPKNYADSLLVLDHGKGVWVWDEYDNQYLDFGAGIAVNALGYGNQDVARVAHEQMIKLVHVSNLYATRPGLELAQMLVGSSPRAGDQPWQADKAAGYFAAVHFGNSGAEANEAALKYARLYAFKTKGPGHHKVMAFSNGFHGRTTGSLSMTENPAYREPFEPLVPGIEFCPYNDIASLQGRIDDSYAAIIVEVVQGEGGLSSIDAQFAQGLNALCRQHDVVLIADEVQTGIGRVGSLYASELRRLEPDIVTLSKPLAGGLPLSATLIPKRINDLVQLGDHGTTFGGGPVTTAVARYVWETVNARGFLTGVRERGSYLEQRLLQLTESYPKILSAVRGEGLLRGIATVDPTLIPGIIADARDAGLLILRSGKNVIRIAPPLTITKDEIDEGVTRLQGVLSRLSN